MPAGRGLLHVGQLCEAADNRKSRPVYTATTGLDCMQTLCSSACTYQGIQCKGYDRTVAFEAAGQPLGYHILHSICSMLVPWILACTNDKVFDATQRRLTRAVQCDFGNLVTNLVVITN